MAFLKTQYMSEMYLNLTLGDCSCESHKLNKQTKKPKAKLNSLCKIS